MSYALEVKNLDKSFGDVHAVNDISFSVKKGELFAFLGINGAGKSTSISIICGLLAKDNGKVYVNGVDTDVDMDAVRNKIGLVFQNSVLDKALSVKDNLKSRSAMYGIVGKEFEDKLDKLSKELDFCDLLNRPVGKLSGGQRRRIDVARALICDPEILILDEPTTGLDPQTRKTLWHVIENRRTAEGMTVFLTTHYMEEAADADYIVILKSGRIVAEGTPHDLKNTYTGDFITIYGVEENVVSSLGVKYSCVGDAYRIEVKNTKEATSLILKHPEVFVDYEIIKGKMDDVFLAVTGEKGGNE